MSRPLGLAAVTLLALGGARLADALRDPALMLRDDPPVHWLVTGDFLYPAVVTRAWADGLPVRGTAFSGATFACPELATFALAPGRWPPGRRRPSSSGTP